MGLYWYSDSNNFRAYNIIAGTWTTLDVGYPLVGYRKQHKMAGWGNKIYMFGGAALYGLSFPRPLCVRIAGISRCCFLREESASLGG